MKPKLIFFPLDLFSHYLRCLKLAEAVKDDFEIFIASSRNPKSNQMVKDNGFGIVECKTVDAEALSIKESRLDHSWMAQKELEPVFLDQVRVLCEQRPYLVISDFSITLGMAAEYSRTTCYALTIAHLSQYSGMNRKAPDFHPAIKLMKNLRIPDWLLSFLTRIGEKVEFRAMHKGIKNIRKKYHLQPRRDYLDELEAEYNLITDIEDFSPMKGLPGNYTYVGPVFHQHPETETELLARLNPDKETIFISLGTFWSSDALYALFNDPIFREYNIVIAGQPKVPIVPDIIQKNFVNLEAILTKTDLMICHGGDATVYQGLSHTVPILGMAFQGEQNWSLQRVSNLGFGETIKLPMSALDMKNKIRLWLDTRKREKARFDAFAQKISLKATQQRFRDALLKLNERTFCSFCRKGTLENSREVLNFPSDVRRYRNQYFRVWRCPSCRSIHSVRILDLAQYYEDYPYDQISNNIFVETALQNLIGIIKHFGVKPDSEILFSGSVSTVGHDIFRKHGLARFDILPRPTRIDQPWIYPDKKYDFIILIECLERTPEPFELLEGIAKCLKPGGRVLIHSPDATRIDLRKSQECVHELHQPYRLHILSSPILMLMAQNAGLHLIDYQCRHFWDTYYPFVNQRLIHALDKITDGTIDATVPMPEIRPDRWWNIPSVLLIGLLGGVFRKNASMLTIFEKQPQG